MPGEIYDFSEVDASNNDETLGGWVEGMKRSNVNDRARENMGAIRRWYEDGEWTRLLEGQNAPTFTVSKTSDTSIQVASSPATDATAKFPLGARVRVSVGGGSATEGILGVATFSTPNTSVPITFPPIFTSETEASTSGKGTAGTPAPLALASFPIVPGSVRITDAAIHTRGHAIIDDGAGNLTHAVDGTVGTIDYATGAGTLNSLDDALDADCLVAYQYTETVPASCDRAEIYLNHTLRDAAFREVGPAGGKLPLYEDFGGAAFKDEGPDSGLDADTVDGLEALALVERAAAATRNFVTNPCGRIAQRGPSIDSTTAFPNDDDSYTLDRWLLLSESNDDFDVDQITNDGPVGIGTSMQLTSTAANPASPNSEKGGLFQILPHAETQQLAGQTVSLSFYAKISGTLDRIDGCLLGWDGTADAVTSDVVSAWNAAGVEPTWVTGASNWIRLGGLISAQESYATPDGTWRRYTLEGVPVTATNLCIALWVDDNDFATGDTLRISGVQLEISPTVTPFREPTQGEQLLECMRFFQKTFPQATAPAQNAGLPGALSALENYDAGALDAALWRFPVPLWKEPVAGDFVTYNPSAADANWDNTQPPDAAAEPNSQSVTISGGTGLVNGDRIHVTVEAEL